MPELNAQTVSDGLLAVLVYAGMVFVAASAAMVFWTWRDMRARSRDPIARIVVSLMVLVLNLPGLLIYLFLRPRETLAEAYERSLEEEALLQEIEEKPLCPGCKQRVKDEWQACPVCHTRLKKPCLRCGQMLELSWSLCPYCAAAQANFSTERGAATSNHVRPAAVSDQHPSSSYSRSSRTGELQFLDNDEI